MTFQRQNLPRAQRLRRRALQVSAALLLGSLAALAPDGPFDGRRDASALGSRAEATMGSDFRLSDLRLFNAVVLLVHDRYVDDDRIHARNMLLSALDYVEKRVAEVLIDEKRAASHQEVTVTVGTATRTFDISGVGDLWQMSVGMKEIFAFIEANLVSHEELPEIEYAAINGMLATLDPHSNLLDPEQYTDMKMHTTGEFGGLGFVVSLRDGRLTIMKVLPRTPAHRGGIRPRDVITQIEAESTVNMDLTEAVKRLRGVPGTNVSFWVDRKGFEKPRKFTLARARISIDSIDPAKLLTGNVGYIRITNFQGNTTSDLRRSMLDLAEKAGGRLKGLVLDLRGNPGGLLDQAIQVTDLFVDDGTIVSTVGMSNKLRERKFATRPGTLKDLPMVVLVSHSSASASEIVSGALKNLDRAMVVGSQTFGKGSVQVLYPQNDDSALKLTVAEYLTPGDISIQDVGVTPDIDLIPALVSRSRIWAFAPRESMRESDLEASMSEEVAGAAPGANPVGFRTAERRNTDEPVAHLTFLRDDVPEGEEIDEFEEPEWKEDFQVRFARELLLDAGATTRKEMLRDARRVVNERSASERRRINEAVGKLGVGWNPPRTEKVAGAPDVSATLEVKGVARAGEEVHLVLTVKNEGSTPLNRVRAWTKTRSPRSVHYAYLFDRIEFVLGQIDPGRTQTWSVPVELPIDLPARHELLDLQIAAEQHEEVTSVPAELELSGKALPRFAFAWGIDDGESPQADGVLSPGEKVKLWVGVKNVGEGAAPEVVATLKNLEDEHLYIHEGRAAIGKLPRGGTALGEMLLELKDGFDEPRARMRVTIYDRDAGEYISSEIQVPVAHRGDAAVRTAGSLRATSATEARAWAAPEAPVVATLKKGAVLPLTHDVGAYHRVSLGEGLSGFVAAEVSKKQGAVRKRPAGVALAFPFEAPTIQLVGLEESPATDQATFALAGKATDATGIRDVYLFLNNQKVYFKAAAGTGDREIPFTTTLELAEGANNLMLFAREDDSLIGRKTVVIFRRPATLAAAVESAAPDTAPAKKSP
ncbi:MAG: MXAN_5808 family serine peptidase [Deltaproteobacteria bacterium]|nr:MXAN_5808 family serine peptidase [Deltaproteobacteria bacterium]